MNFHFYTHLQILKWTTKKLPKTLIKMEMEKILLNNLFFFFASKFFSKDFCPFVFFQILFIFVYFIYLFLLIVFGFSMNLKYLDVNFQSHIISFRMKFTESDTNFFLCNIGHVIWFPILFVLIFCDIELYKIVELLGHAKGIGN